MKNFKIVAILFFACLSFQSAFSQSDKLERFKDRNLITSHIKVYGECGTCKNRIEKALRVPGITVAKWNSDDQFLTVQYNKTKINLDQIHGLVAAVGHDTGKVKAADSVYQRLPDCCRYERKAS